MKLEQRPVPIKQRPEITRQELSSELSTRYNSVLRQTDLEELIEYLQDQTVGMLEKDEAESDDIDDAATPDEMRQMIEDAWYPLFRVEDELKAWWNLSAGWIHFEDDEHLIDLALVFWKPRTHAAIQNLIATLLECSMWGDMLRLHAIFIEQGKDGNVTMEEVELF